MLRVPGVSQRVRRIRRRGGAGEIYGRGCEDAQKDTFHSHGHGDGRRLCLWRDGPGGEARDRGDTGGDAHGGAGGPWPGRHAGDGRVESRFIFYPNKHKICYTIQVSGIARATSAHLHEAPAGVVGPVKLRLTPPRDETSEHECIRGLGERFIKRISGDPTGYYVDVHNDAFSDGAIRGQLTQGGPR
jgi:hypothetical protein